MVTSSESKRPTDLGGLIRARMDAQDLPLAGEQKLFAGYGQNEICDGCKKVIRSTDVLYEVELNPALVLAMHRTCFDVWVDVSRQRSTMTYRGRSPLCYTGGDFQ